MEERFVRTQALIGEDGLTRLKSANVILFGVGGVGSYAAEALIRSGIGSITLVGRYGCKKQHKSPAHRS